MRKAVLAPGEYYHLYNRGVDKRDIFITDGDYQRFSTLLYACNGSQPVDLDEQGKTIDALVERKIERGEPLLAICSYVLMPNHFHLMAKELHEGGISKFMQKLGTAYTGYFNKKRERSGALFQGRFKTRHASKDPYCSYIASYIHLNPIKLIEPRWKDTGVRRPLAAKVFLESYSHSSYLDYLGADRAEGLIIDKGTLPSHCTSAGDFQKEISSWLEYRKVEPSDR